MIQRYIVCVPLSRSRSLASSWGGVGNNQMRRKLGAHENNIKPARGWRGRRNDGCTCSVSTSATIVFWADLCGALPSSLNEARNQCNENIVIAPLLPLLLPCSPPAWVRYQLVPLCSVFDVRLCQSFPLSCQPVFPFVLPASLSLCLASQSFLLSCQPVFPFVLPASLSFCLASQSFLLSCQPVFPFVLPASISFCFANQSFLLSCQPVFPFVLPACPSLCLASQSFPLFYQPVLPFVLPTSISLCLNCQPVFPFVSPIPFVLPTSLFLLLFSLQPVCFFFLLTSLSLCFAKQSGLVLTATSICDLGLSQVCCYFLVPPCLMGLSQRSVVTYWYLLV